MQIRLIDQSHTSIPPWLDLQNLWLTIQIVSFLRLLLEKNIRLINICGKFHWVDLGQFFFYGFEMLRITFEEKYWILSPVLSSLFGRYLIFKFCPKTYFAFLLDSETHCGAIKKDAFVLPWINLLIRKALLQPNFSFRELTFRFFSRKSGNADCPLFQS